MTSRDYTVAAVVNNHTPGLVDDETILLESPANTTNATVTVTLGMGVARSAAYTAAEGCVLQSNVTNGAGQRVMNYICGPYALNTATPLAFSASSADSREWKSAHGGDGVGWGVGGWGKRTQARTAAKWFVLPGSCS